jgi:DNA-binding PadR family transcriptional regulator
MRRSGSLQGSVDLLGLQILSRRPCLHGYAIMSEDALRGLHRMEEAGWVRAEKAVTAAVNRVLRMV